MKVVSLTCPGCGANLEEKKTRCEHCGTNVRLSDDRQSFVESGISCPQCSSVNQFGDKHCGSCGMKLVSLCPAPNCLSENSIRRKYCKKCGKSILGFHIEMLESEQARYAAELQQHAEEMSHIKSVSSSSESRASFVKIVIWSIGGLIAFSFLSAGKQGFIGTIITLVATYFVAANYHSSEDYNLTCSLLLHQEEIERIQEKYEINETKLDELRSPPS